MQEPGLAESAKKVVYTAIAGNYDTISQPVIVRDDFDYVCFVDKIDGTDKCGVWQLREFPYKHDDPTRRARYVKLQPHVVLPEYDYSIWHDANVTIANDYIYRRVDDLIDQQALLAFFAHWGRDCAYDEAMECLITGVDKTSKIVGMVLEMVAHRYPRHKGLIESNVIYRNHTNPKVKAADNMWWRCLKLHSKRDQLSLNYVLWRKHLPYELIFHFNPALTARNSEAFIYQNHNMERKVPKGIRRRTRLARFLRKYIINPLTPKM